MNQNPTLGSGAISRVYAGVAGLTAFVVAVLAGLHAQNGSAHILATALVCMVACYLVGSLLGAIAEHAVRAHLAGYRERHPVPEPSPALDAQHARSE